MKYLILTLFTVSAFAQQHPRLLFSANDRAWLKSQVENNSVRWQALKAECDSYLDSPVGYPDQYGDGGPRNPRVPDSGTNYSTVSLNGSYAGEDYLARVWSLGACYLASKNAVGFSQALNDRYGEKLRQIAISSSVMPGTIKKLVVPAATIRVIGGRATIVSSSLTPMLQGMEIYLSGTGTGLDGYHDISVEVTGNTITFPIPAVQDGTYTSDLYVALRIHPLNKRSAISGISAQNPARITAVVHGLQTGDSTLLEGLEGPWSVLNGIHTVTVIDNSTFSIPVNTTGFGPFNYQYGYGTQFERGKLAQFYVAGNVGSLFATGNSVIVSDLTGCTALNGPQTLTVESTSQINLGVTTDESCTNYSYSSLRDSGYSYRNYAVFLPLVYDWAYDKLSPSERQTIVDRINLYNRESKRSEQDSTTLQPSHNYFAGFLNGAILSYLAFDVADNKEPNLETFVNDRLYGQGYFLEYFNRWAIHGGYPQGNREYGTNAATSLFIAALAAENAGLSLTPNGNWGWFGGHLEYLMSFVSPTFTQMDFNNFTAGPNSNDTGINAPPLDEPNRVNPNATMIMSYWARKVGHPLAAQFTKFHFDTKDAMLQSIASGLKPRATSQTQIGTVPKKAYEFLFEDPTATQEEWKTEARKYGKGFNGNYVTTRTGWTAGDVQLTFDTSPEIDNTSQGKSRWNAGTVTIKRGNKVLIDYPNALVSQYGSSTQHSTFQNLIGATVGSDTWRFDNVIFADAVGSAQTGSQDFRSQCFVSTPAATGAHSRKQIMPLIASFDRVAHLATVDYWRAINNECHYGRPSPINARSNVVNWTRDVTFLRSSGVAVVRDALKTVSATDNRFLSWVTPTQPILESSGRYKVQNPAGSYLGTISILRPLNPSISINTWASGSFINNLEIHPASGDPQSVHFVTVLDPATSEINAKSAVELSATAGMVFQVGSSVVAYTDGVTNFSYTEVAAINEHVIIGLSPGTYYLSKVGSVWTVSTVNSADAIVFTVDSNSAAVINI